LFVWAENKNIALRWQSVSPSNRRLLLARNTHLVMDVLLLSISFFFLFLCHSFISFRCVDIRWAVDGQLTTMQVSNWRSGLLISPGVIKQDAD
jgi:hypothetical protein